MKPCGRFCPLTACSACIWSGGVEPQADSDAERVADSGAIAYDKGAKQTAPSRVNELGASPPVPAKES